MTKLNRQELNNKLVAKLATELELKSLEVSKITQSEDSKQRRFYSVTFKEHFPAEQPSSVVGSDLLAEAEAVAKPLTATQNYFERGAGLNSGIFNLLENGQIEVGSVLPGIMVQTDVSPFEYTNPETKETQTITSRRFAGLGNTISKAKQNAVDNFNQNEDNQERKVTTVETVNSGVGMTV